MSEIQRRSFLRYTASGLGLSGLLQSLGPLSADEIKIDRGIARFSSEIEPLVEFLESTPRDEIIAKTAVRVQNGLSYRELLAALFVSRSSQRSTEAVGRIQVPRRPRGELGAFGQHQWIG